MADNALSDAAEQEKKCCWRQGATPAWTSKKLGLRIPQEATDRRAGFKEGSRYDTALLVFTLPEDEAKAYVERMVPPDSELLSNTEPQEGGYPSTAPFSRLKLPEPEKLTKGMRKVYLVPGDTDSAPESRRLRHSVHFYEHAFERTRIYIRAVIE
ncbi:hypothetical protein [Streptomyces reniochalinae]|uniref:Uncharacterized protein n=1 Tax=Streptomyces reniochalinae TaxID=2250578 RepID=A0A367EHK6_9ACTN|nr:hypothetical protein [Streptomyces reniochalinae]RCG16670.1 hypothetical protein DQ392_21430 [Streptomyces reniochalinae]